MWRGCCASRRPQQAQAQPLQEPRTAPAHDGPGVPAANMASKPSVPAYTAPAEPALASASNEVVSPTTMASSFCETVFAAGLWDYIARGRPCHIPAAAEALPSQLDIDLVLAALSRGSSNGATSAHKKGEAHPRDSFWMAYLDQASLHITDAERFLPPLMALCEALAPSFDFVTSRLMLDPPTRSMPPLVAEGDVLVVQIWGTQRLILRRPVHGLPVTAPRPEPLLKPELRPGDALFLPTGVECCLAPLPPAARQDTAADTEPKLYVLLKLRDPTLSLDVCLRNYLEDLVRTDRFPSSVDTFFRSAITRRTRGEARAPESKAEEEGPASTTAAGAEELPALLKQSATKLAEQVSVSGLREYFKERLEQSRKAQRESASRLSVGGAGTEPLPPGTIASEDMVRVSSGVECLCEPGSTVARFRRGTETLNLPIAETASYLISRLCDGRPRVVGSLPCKDPFERICVLQVLVGKGCFEFRAACSPSA